MLLMFAEGYQQCLFIQNGITGLVSAAMLPSAGVHSLRRALQWVQSSHQSR